jgi:adenylate cyclase class IV
MFGLDLDPYEQRIKEISEKEKTRKMSSIYFLTAGNTTNNLKIREGVMDIKELEQTYKGLEQWNPFLVGKFPLKADVIRTVVFPAMGIESPVFEREEYTLEQLLNEVICTDPDLAVAYVKKTRHAYTVNKCITEIAEITVNGAFLKTICIEAEDPERVLKARKKLGIDPDTENVNYPLALKRVMGLAELPEHWK